MSTPSSTCPTKGVKSCRILPRTPCGDSNEKAKHDCQLERRVATIAARSLTAVVVSWSSSCLSRSHGAASADGRLIHGEGENNYQRGVICVFDEHDTVNVCYARVAALRNPHRQLPDIWIPVPHVEDAKVKPSDVLRSLSSTLRYIIRPRGSDRPANSYRRNQSRSRHPTSSRSDHAAYPLCTCRLILNDR